MLRYAFRLSLSSDRYLAYYRGEVQHVVARCADGQTVQFPASLLTPFVSTSGVHGDFVLTCDDDHRGARLARAGTGR